MVKLGNAFDRIIKIGVCDANEEKNKSIAQKFNVTGFPTLKLFINGEAQDYNGARTMDGMKKEIMNAINK